MRWTQYSAAASGGAAVSQPASAEERKEALVKQLVAARGNPAQQEELVLELHNSLLGAEKLIANLQGGKRQAHRSRAAVKALLTSRDTDLLKVRRVCWSANGC